MTSEYKEIADALKREYGHEFTTHGAVGFDFSKHPYVGRAGTLLMRANAEIERLTHENEAFKTRYVTRTAYEAVRAEAERLSRFEGWIADRAGPTLSLETVREILEA